MTNNELAELGAQWAGNTNYIGNPGPLGNTGSIFVTRLHVRYDAQSFPEDLAFTETADRENFQARYVMHHPFQGNTSCTAGKFYHASLPDRFKREARNVADLTGWSEKDVEARMAAAGEAISGAH
jgi:hypothetical protein